jgi:hypothetical protein
MRFTDSKGRYLYGTRDKKWKVPTALLYALVVAFGWLNIAAVTQIELTQQVRGILPFANGGVGWTSVAAGIVRFTSGTALTSAELSGDATTSGSNAVTVVKVNGTSVGTNAAADQVIRTTASATASWVSIPDCDAGALQYDTTAHTFTCGSVLTGTVVDMATPTGTINGTNDTFTLAQAPSPAGSLHLYKNGQLMIAGGADYTLTTLTIVYAAGAIPITNDVHRASYRY